MRFGLRGGVATDFPFRRSPLSPHNFSDRRTERTARPSFSSKIDGNYCPTAAVRVVGYARRK